MKPRVISFVYLVIFIIFLLCAEYIDSADLALILNLVLLVGMLLYYGIIGIIKIKLIPKSNIIIWFCLVVATIPIILILEKMGIVDTSTGAFGLSSGGLEYLFFILINLIFVFALIVENIIMYLVFKNKRTK